VTLRQKTARSSW